MDLTLSDRHRALQAESARLHRPVRSSSPPVGGGGGRKRPDQRVLDWQALLIEHGFAARGRAEAVWRLWRRARRAGAALITEAFNTAGLSLGIQGQGIRMLVPTLLEVGTEDQRQRWIAPTIRGEIIWARAIPSRRRAATWLAADAPTVEDGHSSSTAQKIWTSSAHYADMMFLLVRTEPDRRSISASRYLLLPMDTPGIEVRPLRR